MSFKEKINESIEEKIYESLFNLQEKKKLDPVGKADADIDNDGDVDDSDEYLHNRRKAIKKAMAKEEVETVDEANKSATPSRYDMIKMAAKKVEKQNAAKERQAMRDAKSAMKKPGATKGMAEPKMDESIDLHDFINSLDEAQLDEISAELARKAVAHGLARSDRHWDKHGFNKHGAWLDTKSNKAARHLANRHGEKEVSKAVRDSQNLTKMVNQNGTVKYVSSSDIKKYTDLGYRRAPR